MGLLRLKCSGPDDCCEQPPALNTLTFREASMSDQQPTADLPFFQPLPDHDTLQTAYLLWRLAEKVRVDESGCWIWTGSRNRHGYATMGVQNRGTQLVHRIVYRLCVGKVAPSQEVCHDCDNPSCVKPAHLFVGTHTDNMRDAANKGRIKVRDSRGEKNPFAKLTEEIVLHIRRRWPELKGTKDRAGVLAKEAGVTRPTVYRVVNGAIWRHVL